MQHLYKIDKERERERDFVILTYKQLIKKLQLLISIKNIYNIIYI